MNIQQNKFLKKIAILASMLSMGIASMAQAAIVGVEDTTFNLVAKDGYITSGDGDSLYMWGYSTTETHNNGLSTNGGMQYPGPTLIVNEGDSVTINLTNEISILGKVSIVFPGQKVTATGGATGLMTNESTGAADTVSYTFTATHPGTYIYHSGTNPELHTEMGLVGALIIRPSTDPETTAYGPDSGSDFEVENLYLVSQVDADIHNQVELGYSFAPADPSHVNMSQQKPAQWFINGRSLSDDLFPDFAPWLPTQPYSALVVMEPGDRTLIRFVGASRDTHPPHLHGNNGTIIARDGRVMQTASGAGADLSVSDNTISVVSLATHDVIWTWTGKDIGWDIYGDLVPNCVDLVDNHTGAATSGTPYSPGDGFDDEGHNAWEWCEDDGKPFPVVLPELQDMTFGGFYSGSPFMNDNGSLPPGEGGLNLWNAFIYPWHSHTEFELTNNDVFPGGMFTAVVIIPPTP